MSIQGKQTSVWVESYPSSSRYLAVVQLLNDSLAFLADITNANKFRLSVTLKEMAANTLDHGSSRTSAGDIAVLNVPKDANWRNVLTPTTLWRT